MAQVHHQVRSSSPDRRQRRHDPRSLCSAALQRFPASRGFPDDVAGPSPSDPWRPRQCGRPRRVAHVALPDGASSFSHQRQVQDNLGREQEQGGYGTCSEPVRARHGESRRPGAIAALPSRRRGLGWAAHRIAISRTARRCGPHRRHRTSRAQTRSRSRPRQTTAVRPTSRMTRRSDTWTTTSDEDTDKTRRGWRAEAMSSRRTATCFLLPYTPILISRGGTRRSPRADHPAGLLRRCGSHGFPKHRRSVSRARRVTPKSEDGSCGTSSSRQGRTQNSPATSSARSLSLERRRTSLPTLMATCSRCAWQAVPQRAPEASLGPCSTDSAPAPAYVAHRRHRRGKQIATSEPVACRATAVALYTNNLLFTSARGQVQVAELRGIGHARRSCTWLREDVTAVHGLR